MVKRRELLVAAKQVEVERLRNKIESEISRQFLPAEIEVVKKIDQIIRGTPSWDAMIKLGVRAVWCLFIFLPLAIMVWPVLGLAVTIMFFYYLFGCLSDYFKLKKSARLLWEIIDGDSVDYRPIVLRFRQIVIEAGGVWPERMLPQESLQGEV